MIKEKKNTDVKEKRVSARLNEAEAKKLEEIEKSRKLSTSDAVRYAIMGIPILKIGNVESLAEEFCKIREAIEQNSIDDDIRKKVDSLCQSLSDLLAKLDQ